MSVFRTGLFSGKVALITGGGSGIGKGIVKELLSLDCQVAIASRNVEKLKETTKEFSESGNFPGKIQHFECNVRKEDDVRNVIGDVISEFGQLDFLVNNAGGQFPSKCEDISLKGWNAVLETNLNGPFLLSREAYAQTFKHKGGCIVNIIADMFRGFPMMSHTGAARAAVENLTKSMAIEWCERGVRVNAIAPGVIYSDSAKQNYTIDVFETAKPNLPTKRCGTIQEVSSAVCFLLSPGAAFINGATLRVDGGSSLYSPLMYTIQDHDKQPQYEWN